MKFKSVFGTNYGLFWLILVDVAFGILYAIHAGGIEFYQNLFPEIIGINITVLIIDKAVKAREEFNMLGMEFRSDIQNYHRYLQIIKLKVETLACAIEKEIGKDTVFILVSDLKEICDNPPIRWSFNDKYINKIRGIRIGKEWDFTKDKISKLQSILSNDIINSYELRRLVGEFYRASLYVLQLNSKNEAIKLDGK